MSGTAILKGVLDLPALEVPIRCSGATHSIVWEQGALRTADHDMEAERALTAFGALPPPCVQVVQAWAGDWRISDVAALTGSTELVALGDAAAAARRALIASLPDKLRLVLALSLVRGGPGVSEAEPAPPAAHEATKALLATVPPGEAPLVACLAPHDRAPRAVLGMRHGGRILAVAFVGPNWHRRVLAEGVAVVDGHMVLDVARPEPGSLDFHAIAVEWVDDVPVLRSARIVGGRRLTWSDRAVESRNPMSFFQPPQLPPHQPVVHPRQHPHNPLHGPPPYVIGALVPLRLVLARTDDVAVVINGFTAYAEGFEFHLQTWARTALPRMSMGIHHPFESILDEKGELDTRIVRFGIQYADGGKATNLDMWSYPHAQGSGPRLWARGSGGGGSSYGEGFWASPLPPEGPLAFVVEWPAFDVPLTRVEIDAAVLRQAAAGAEPIWPD